MGCEAQGEGGGSSQSMNTLSAALLLPAFTSSTKNHNGVLCCLGWLKQIPVMLRAMWGVEDGLSVLGGVEAGFNRTQQGCTCPAHSLPMAAQKG